jgi:hypothetical protein
LKTLLLIFMSVSLGSAGTLFSNLGTPVYQAGSGSLVEGVAPWITQARPFTVSGSGDFNVTQIDLGMVHQLGASTFVASIWSSNSGAPGTALDSWTLTTAEPLGSCCLLATQTGITGLTLTGGDLYFMVAGPVGSNDGSKQEWADNTIGQIVTVYGSLNGGSTWIAETSTTNAAFDVLGDPVVSSVPEPGTLTLLGGGFVAIAAMLRRKRRLQ